MDPIVLDLGIISIKWYSLLIFVAIIVGGGLVIKESKKWKISEDFIINLAFYLIPFALIGARLYFVAFNWDYYSNNLNEIIAVWNGGLAIHGALIVGLLWIIIYSKKHKVNTFRLLDITVVALLIGQAIGRWGNFFNSEAYGPETTLGFLKSIFLPDFIINGMNIDGIYYQPTFLYESLWCIIGFVIILILRKRKYLKLGQLTSFYMIWYGTGRFLIESLRQDSLMWGNIRMAQAVSIGMIIIGIIMYIWLNRGSKFERLYNEIPTRKPSSEIPIYNQTTIMDALKQGEKSVIPPVQPTPTGVHEKVAYTEPIIPKPFEEEKKEEPKPEDLGEFKW